jgi:uncharacterized membrane protein YwaF
VTISVSPLAYGLSTAIGALTALVYIVSSAGMALVLFVLLDLPFRIIRVTYDQSIPPHALPRAGAR